MNRLHIFGMMALAVAGLASCEPDDSPKINTPTEFILNTPPFAEQLYQLQADHTIEFTCSQPNYGITVAPTYSLEVSLYPDFGASLPAPDEGDEDAIPYSVIINPLNPQSAVMEIEDKDLADAILAMRGIKNESQYTPATQAIYVRAIASINSQAVTTITSTNAPVELKQVADYFSLEASVIPVLYTPGSSNDWKHDPSMKLEAYEKDGKEWIKFRGLVYLNGEFKFTNQPDWNGINYGNAGADGKLSTDGGASNLTLPATGAGLYWADVNIKTLSYKLTFVSSFAIIGDLNGWNTSTPIEMTHSDDYKIWTGKANFTGGGFKFIINGPDSEWALNYGGPLDGLTFNGPNITDTAGEHTVTVDLSKIPYTATFE